ncbi:hypothetical protein CDAR_378571 [Caerostris darwini]|uniref:Transmembrane protein n=1 Tax=Caerostris darwini TaxID=1538125 RepID=A0AAV4RZ27_9ARAC|nr:hypothetical protein CDAR_378571 [Caerostris darwini]
MGDLPMKFYVLEFMNPQVMSAVPSLNGTVWRANLPAYPKRKANFANMKAVIAIFLFAMVIGAMSQAYNYGYNTYTPGARVSHYASSGGVPVVAAPGYAYNYGYGVHPYRWY